MAVPISSKLQPRNRIREFVIKFRHILGPVIILWWLAVLIYGACCWVCIHFHLHLVKQEVWEVLLPFMLALWVVGIMGPRLKILPDSHTIRSWRDFVGMLIGVTSVAMMILTQEALSHHLAQVTSLTAPDSLVSCPETAYYQFDTVEIEKGKMGYTANTRLIARRAGMGRAFELYVVFPFRGQETVWYALSFKDRIHLTLLSEQDEEAQYRRFLQRCEQRVMHYDFEAKHFFKRVAFSEDYEEFRDAVRQGMGSEGKDLERLVFLEPMDRLPQDRSRLNLIWIGGSFLIGLFLVGISLFFIPVDFNVVRKDGRFRKNQPTKSEFWAMIQEAIWPNRTNWPRTILPFMLLIVYVVMLLGGMDFFAPSGQDLLRWGGVQHSALAQGEWWRLFTSVFVHGGMLHVFSNVVALCVVLWICVPLFGPYKPLWVFLISGVGSTWIATCFSQSIFVGASGGIMGLVASVLVVYVFYPAKRVPREGGWLLWMILGGTLLMGLFGGVSNVAHVTGLGIGAVFGILLFRPPEVTENVSRRNRRSNHR